MERTENEWEGESTSERLQAQEKQSACKKVCPERDWKAHKEESKRQRDKADEGRKP